MAALKWTVKELRLLGKRPDRELSRQFGRSVQAICIKRNLLGIPRYISEGSPRPWTCKEDYLLGTKPDREIARFLKRTTISIAKRRRALKIRHFRDRPWTTREDRMLGTITDHQLSHEFGRSVRQVRERRRKLGILPWIYTRRNWTFQAERMLGKKCDFTVAKAPWPVAGFGPGKARNTRDTLFCHAESKVDRTRGRST